MDTYREVPAHEQKRTLTDIVFIPEHIEREESPEFRQTKHRLKEDGHYKCWVCGIEEGLEVHHLGCEWSLQNDCDFDKLKAFCEEWDPYGYGKLLKGKPILDADDIRNMLVLCKEHHVNGTEESGIAHGIHNVTFPTWVIQKFAKQGTEPVPEKI